jgi:hypothetical protein
LAQPRPASPSSFPSRVAHPALGRLARGPPGAACPAPPRSPLGRPIGTAQLAPRGPPGSPSRSPREACAGGCSSRLRPGGTHPSLPRSSPVHLPLPHDARLSLSSQSRPRRPQQPCPGAVCPLCLVLRGEPRHLPPLPRRPLLLPRHLLATSVARHAQPRPRSRPPPRSATRPGVRGLAPPLGPARSPAPSTAPACAQHGYSRRPPRCGLCLAQPPLCARCGAHSPASSSAWPWRSPPHAQSYARRAPFPVLGVARRRSRWPSPSAARDGPAPPSWCVGCPARPRPAHGVLARFAVPPVRHIALRHACDEPVYPPAYSVYPHPRVFYAR